METERPVILPAEYVGEARSDETGYIPIGVGDDPVRIPWTAGSVGVYVRRVSSDLSVIEIAIARHDGLAQEELDEKNHEASRYLLGAKEYWRGEMVGKYRYGTDRHLMTDEEFEQEWAEDGGTD